MKRIYQLKLGDKLDLDSYIVTRVHNGWLYNFYTFYWNENGNHKDRTFKSSTFVPFEEIKEESK